jgi:predicted  nucleic acid-binding Zn-ribbon protein
MPSPERVAQLRAELTRVENSRVALVANIFALRGETSHLEQLIANDDFEIQAIQSRKRQHREQLQAAAGTMERQRAQVERTKTQEARLRVDIAQAKL